MQTRELPFISPALQGSWFPGKRVSSSPWSWDLGPVGLTLGAQREVRRVLWILKAQSPLDKENLHRLCFCVIVLSLFHFLMTLKTCSLGCHHGSESPFKKTCSYMCVFACVRMNTEACLEVCLRTLYNLTSLGMWHAYQNIKYTR